MSYSCLTLVKDSERRAPRQKKATLSSWIGRAAACLREAKIVKGEHQSKRKPAFSPDRTSGKDIADNRPPDDRNGSCDRNYRSADRNFCHCDRKSCHCDRKNQRGYQINRRSATSFLPAAEAPCAASPVGHRRHDRARKGDRESAQAFRILPRIVQ